LTLWLSTNLNPLTKDANFSSLFDFCRHVFILNSHKSFSTSSADLNLASITDGNGRKKRKIKGTNKRKKIWRKKREEEGKGINTRGIERNGTYGSKVCATVTL
jgi:hypothetical protein